MTFDPSPFDNSAWSANEKRAAKINKLFSDVIEEICLLSVGISPKEGKLFSFSQFPALKKRVQKAFEDFADSLMENISTGINVSWSAANKKNDAMIRFLNRKTGIPLRVLGLYDPRNTDALSAFQNRKDKGLGLSDRVWRNTQQARQEMEMALDLGLGEGKSAAQLSRSVRGFLNEPERLFRRVRNKHGELALSQAAKAYSPGQGVYRSSYKNAMRLARTETNMAYREADFQRWSNMDFVIGIEVRLSNNPRHCPVCVALAGKYPKDYKFIGNHPQCRCYAVPILMPGHEFDKLSRLNLSGEDTSDFEPKGQIQDIHQGAKDWYEENKKRIKGWSSIPYFVRDNAEYFKVR